MSNCSLPIALRGRNTSHGHTGKWTAAAYPLQWEEEKHPMDTQVNEQLQPLHCIERKKHIWWTHRLMNSCSLPIAMTGRKTSHGHTDKWAAAAYPMHWEEEKHPMHRQVNEQLQRTHSTERKWNTPWAHRSMSNSSLPNALRGRKHHMDTQVNEQLQPTICTEREKNIPCTHR